MDFCVSSWGNVLVFIPNSVGQNSRNVVRHKFENDVFFTFSNLLRSQFFIRDHTDFPFGAACPAHYNCLIIGPEAATVSAQTVVLQSAPGFTHGAFMLHVPVERHAKFPLLGIRDPGDCSPVQGQTRMPPEFLNPEVRSVGK